MQIDYNKTIYILRCIYKKINLKMVQQKELIIQCEDKLKKINECDPLYDKIINRLNIKKEHFNNLSNYLNTAKELINSFEIENISINYDSTIESCLYMYNYFSTCFDKFNELFNEYGYIKIYMENNNLKSDKNYKTVCDNYLLIGKQLNSYMYYIELINDLIKYYFTEGLNKNNLIL